jgi:hypothetical protein
MVNVKVKLYQCLNTMPWRHISCLIKHHAMIKYWGRWGIAQGILNLGLGWRWVVSIVPQPLFPHYPWDRKLSGPQSQGKHPIFVPAGNWTHHPAHIIVSILTDWQMQYMQYSFASDSLHNEVRAIHFHLVVETYEFHVSGGYLVRCTNECN